MSWVGDLISAITSAFTGIGDAIFNFLKDGFTTLFLNTTTVEGVTTVTGVSAFGIFGFVLMGLSLALGLTYFITNLVRRKI